MSLNTKFLLASSSWLICTYCLMQKGGHKLCRNLFLVQAMSDVSRTAHVNHVTGHLSGVTGVDL